jgi:hypothetical protein
MKLNWLKSSKYTRIPAIPKFNKWPKKGMEFVYAAY